MNVSVIIPAFNAAEFIEETLESVLNQTHEVTEVIVIDDNSTDTTWSVVSRFPSITLLKNSGKGVASARNLGAERAKGELLAFLDADDIWSPEKISKQLETMQSYRWSHTDSRYFGEKTPLNNKLRSELTSLLAGNVAEQIFIDNFLTTSTVMIERALFLELGGFDESLAALEDWNFWLKAAVHERLGYLDSPLTDYRVYTGSTSRDVKRVLPLHEEVIALNYEELETNQIASAAARRKALITSYSICAYIAEDSEDYWWSLKCNLKALALAPLNMKIYKRVCVSSIKLALNLFGVTYK